LEKKSPNFLKSSQNNPKNAKIETMLLSSLFGENVINLTKDVTFLGYFIISKNRNGPTKSSLIVEKFTKSSLFVEKFAQSGHPN